MKKIYVILSGLIGFTSVGSFGQCTGAGGCALQIHGAIISMSGGISGTPVYINVAQTNIGAIYRPTSGHVYSENQYHYLNIQAGTGTGAYLYPFGTGVDQTAPELAKYVPVTFNKSSAGASDVYISSKAIGIANDNTPVFSPVSNMGSVWGGDATASTLNRWWEINVSAATTADVTLSVNLDTESGGCTGVAAATWKPQRWCNSAGVNACMGGTANGPTWELPAAVSTGFTGVTTGVRTVTTGSISTFSPWLISKTSAPLPVELLDFSALCRDGKVSLSWSTATETNNDFYTIERSTDGVAYFVVEIVKGAGNSSSLKKYDYVDASPEAVPAYYRLRQTDFDGRQEVFKSVSVDCNDPNSGSGNGTASGGDGNGRLTVYPNPNNGENIYVKFNGFEPEEPVLVVLIDVLGQTVYTKVTITDGTGTTLEAIDNMNHLAAGVYTVVGSARNEMYKQKLIIR